MKKTDIQKYATLAMLSALAYISLFLIHFPIIPSASFLSCDVKDVMLVIYALRSHKELKQYLKNYEEEIMPGYGHGEFLMKHTDECRKKIRDTIRAGISDRIRREN